MNKAITKLGLGNPKWPSKATYGQRGAMKASMVAKLGPQMAKSSDLIIREEESAEKAGARVVQENLDSWAGSSNNVTMQTAIRDEFDVEGARMDHLGHSYTPVDPKELAQGRAYSRIEYENTQKFLRDNKIEYVSVYRGQGATAFPGHYDGPATIMMQPANSWSTSLTVASKFGGGKIIMAARVPASRVLSTAASGRGCLNESEVIIFGGKMTVHAVSRSIGDWKKRIVGVQRGSRKPRTKKSTLTSMPNAV